MILLLRHGQTAGNLDKTAYIDLREEQMVLTGAGHEEIAALRAPLAATGMAVTGAVVAPERRCVQTAELLPIPAGTWAVDDRLRAQCWGDLAFSGARETLEETSSWPAGLDVRFPGGETAREVLQRCTPMADELLEQERAGAGGDGMVVVAHGVVIRMLLARLQRWSDEQIEASRSVSTGTGVAVSVDRRKGRVSVEVLAPTPRS